MKARSISWFLLGMISLYSCTFDSQGNPMIADWFKIVLLLFVVFFIFLIVSGAKQSKTFKEELKRKNINIGDYKTIGSYVGGHPKINKGIERVGVTVSQGFLKIYNFPNDVTMPKYVTKIDLYAITNITVEDASSIEKKITVGRLFLVGIFAFAWKKKKKSEMAFVSIKWKDKFEHDTIFSFEGKDAFEKANTTRNELIRLCS